MTNTERLIDNFKHCQREGQACQFMVGRYTGNGPSVVAALRRRGYSVEPTGKGSYQITAGPTDCDAGAAETKVVTTPAAKLSMPALCDLWNKLSDVCVSSDGEELDESFMHFEAGDSLSDVWSWFERQNPAFLVGEAGRFIGPNHPYRKGGELVEKALSHIAAIHPAVDQVIYNEELRWCYSGDGVPITFTDKEDIGLLEDAADEAYNRGLVNVVIKI